MRTLTTEQPKAAFLPSVQLGRGIAALLVLLYHVSNAVFGADGRYVFHGGAAGVDIFFVVSGFIITYVSRGDTARQFLTKRTIRIVPLYYFYTTLVVAILLVMPSLYANLRFTWSFVAASYLFILSPSNVGSPGVAVGVGWTLAYEAYFYVLMTLGIFLLKARGWMLTVAVILAGAAASRFVNPPAPLLPMLTALPLEFLGGVFLAQLYLRRWQLKLPVASALIVAGFAVIVYAGTINVVSGVLTDPSRVLWYGVPATGIIAGLISLHGKVSVARPLLWLGDISYSLYLSHAFVIEAVMRVMRPLASSPTIKIPVLLATTTLVAVLSYRIVEVPSTRFLSRALAVRNPLPASRPS